MTTPLESAARGYAELANSLADRWREHLDAVEAKVKGDAYTANQAVADLAASAALATESWLLLAYEAVDAASTLAAERPERHFVESKPFRTRIAGAKLALAAPLVNVSKSDELRAGAAWCDPETLADGQNEFRLRADATLRRSGVYSGTVRAVGAGDTEDVPVRITVS